MKAYVKDTDIEIIGTAETVQATAQILPESFEQDADGELVYDYDGYTKIWWDTQTTETLDDKTVFVTDFGDEYTADRIELRDE